MPAAAIFKKIPLLTLRTPECSWGGPGWGGAIVTLEGLFKRQRIMMTKVKESPKNVTNGVMMLQSDILKSPSDCPSPISSWKTSVNSFIILPKVLRIPVWDLSGRGVRVPSKRQIGGILKKILFLVNIRERRIWVFNPSKRMMHKRSQSVQSCHWNKVGLWHQWCDLDLLQLIVFCVSFISWSPEGICEYFW